MEATTARDTSGVPPGQPGSPRGPLPSPYKKSLVVAYLLYFMGWWCGAHHWYLERHPQAVLWMTSFGGFGIGAGLDFFRLPWYVREANGEWLRGERGFSFGAFVAFLLFSQYYSAVFSGMPVIVAQVGGTLMGMLALVTGRKCLAAPGRTSLMCMGVYSALNLQQGMAQEDGEVSAVLAASCARNVVACCQGTLPDSVPSVGRRSGPSRFGIFLMTLLGMVVTAHYIEVRTSEGEPTTLAAQFGNLGETLYNVYVSVNKMGWEEAFSTARSMGGSAEAKALRSLELENGATLKDIKTAYKRLSRLHHPDVEGGSHEKQKEINEAFRILKNVCSQFYFF